MAKSDWIKQPKKYFRVTEWLHRNGIDKLMVYSGGTNFWWFVHQQKRNPTSTDYNFEVYKRGAFHRKKDAMRIAQEYMLNH